ncbi:hypothetical protein GCM10027436_85900 [Actinophytocola sediminis]
MLAIWRRFRSGGWRQVVVVALIAGWLAAIGWLVRPAFVTSQDTRDARDVFCLQPTERGALADAAVALGVARSGSAADQILVGDASVPILRWRDQWPDDFVAACDALSAVRGKSTVPGEGVNTVVLPLFSVVLTSALAFAATRWQHRATRGQADAGELRAAVTAYGHAANALLDSRLSFPADEPTTDLDAARATLVGRLNGIVGRKQAWTAVREVLTKLRDGELGTSLDADLQALRDTATRQQRITELRAQVREVAEIGFLVADALAEPGTADRRLIRDGSS